MHSHAHSYSCAPCFVDLRDSRNTDGSADLVKMRKFFHVAILGRITVVFHAHDDALCALCSQSTRTLWTMCFTKFDCKSDQLNNQDFHSRWRGLLDFASERGLLTETTLLAALAFRMQSRSLPLSLALFFSCPCHSNACRCSLDFCCCSQQSSFGSALVNVNWYPKKIRLLM